MRMLRLKIKQSTDRIQSHAQPQARHIMTLLQAAHRMAVSQATG
jgi:hypothetical protein